jgi:FkbM family methyltransferase
MRIIRTTRGLLLALIAVLVAAGLVVVGMNYAKLEWRARVFALKLSGGMDEVPLADVLSVIAPMSSQERNFNAFVQAVETDAERACPVLWRTPHGEYWGTVGNRWELGVLAVEEYVGIYERGAVRIEEGDTVVDVGAHVGTFVRYALSQGAGRVVAVEPNPTSAACLRQTFASQIASGRVVVVEAAAGEEEGVLRLSFDEWEASSTVVSRESAGASGTEVRMVALDRVVEELALEHVDFIKMDIEGAERFALAGAEQMIRTHQPKMAICIYHRADDPEVISEIVLGASPSYEVSTRGGFQAYFH